MLALEQSVLASFTDRAPCKTKVHRPPSAAALAEAEHLRGQPGAVDPAQKVVIDLSAYAVVADQLRNPRHRGRKVRSEYVADADGRSAPLPAAARSFARERFACLPEPWTLNDFVFAAQPGVDEKLIRDLAPLRLDHRGDLLVGHGPRTTGRGMSPSPAIRSDDQKVPVSRARMSGQVSPGPGLRCAGL
ncbi:hypothetical protein ACIBKX_36955 [Streptomyces sp. NPDC050658]|uniref:hypothetical protein n=1 Tax=unclassified Streptomyces TaxID=2593676 RepID=UPI003430FAAC